MNGLKLKLRMHKGKETFLRHVLEIPPISTSHGVGKKRVVVTQKDVGKPITQIAYTTLCAGEKVLEHTHPTMEEHFFFLSGKCKVLVNGVENKVLSNDYLYIPAGHCHILEALVDTKILTIGIEINNL